jgi:3-keto-5-aminohexanoate cleavage enzyme
VSGSEWRITSTTAYYRRGELVKNNAQFAARAVRIVRELNKEPATPDETRKILGLTKK